MLSFQVHNARVSNCEQLLAIVITALSDTGQPGEEFNQNYLVYYTRRQGDSVCNWPDKYNSRSWVSLLATCSTAASDTESAVSLSLVNAKLLNAVQFCDKQATDLSVTPFEKKNKED